MHPPESPRLTTTYYIPMIGIQKWMSVEHPMSYCLKEWTPLILEFHKGKSGVTRFCILTPANVSCPKSVCYKFSIIRALYKNVSIELWFNAISFCGIEKCLLDILDRGLALVSFRKTSFRYKYFWLVLNFSFCTTSRHYFYNGLFSFWRRGEKRVGRKTVNFITHCWFYRIRIQNK